MGEHPEDFCDECERPNMVWVVDSDRWNLAVGGREHSGRILCPQCFVLFHEIVTGLQCCWELRPYAPFRGIDWSDGLTADELRAKYADHYRTEGAE